MDKTQFESLDQMADATAAAFSQAVAIGCHHHICRGKTTGKDDLFKLTLHSFFWFYFEFRIKIEGGKNTPFAKAHLALKKALDRIRMKK